MSIFKKVAKRVNKSVIRPVFGNTGPSIGKVARTAYRSNPIYGLVKTTQALRKSKPAPRRRRG